MSNYGKMSLADKQLLTAVDQLIDSLLSANPCNPSEIYSSKDYSWEDIKERGAVIGGVFQYKLNEQDMLFVKIQCVYDLKPEGFNFTTPTNFKYRANIWCVLDETPIPVDVIEGINPNPEVDLVPVVDINTPEVKTEGYDRTFLEKKGVDVNHALELLGDMEMYNMTISDFMKEVEDKWGRIVEYRDNNNMPDYAIEVHSLKSDCKYLGFMKLADIAYQHELKSKENDLFFVQDHFAELEEEYKKVLEIAKEYVEHNPVSDE